MIDHSTLLATTILENTHDLSVFALDRHLRYIAFTQRHADFVQDVFHKTIQPGMEFIEVFGSSGKGEIFIACFNDALSGKPSRITSEQGIPTLTQNLLDCLISPYVEDGEVVAVTCLMKNITEERKSELKRLQKEEELDLFFEHSINGFLFMMLDEPIEWNDTVDKEKTLDYVFDHQRLTKVNQAYLDQYGYTIDEVIGETPAQSFAHDLVQGREAWRRMFDHGQLQVMTQEIKKDGSRMWVKGNYVCLYDEYGRIIGHFGTQNDVTIEQNAQYLLKSNEELFRAIFEQAEIGISYGPIDERYGRMNRKYCDIVGYTAEELNHLTFAQITHPDDLALDYENMVRMLAKEIDSYSIDKRFVRKDGSIVWTHLTASMIYHELEKKSFILAILQDISDKKRAEEEMLYLNFHDHLTGLYNRRFYEEELRRLDIQRNLPITLVMIDANGLKLMNDAFGHEAGDQSLKKIAEALKRVCRQDEIIARIGGDEFVILLPKTQKQDADEIVRRIHLSVSMEKVENIILSVSIGSATKSDQETTMRDVFKMAEDAMYRQKLTDSSSILSKTIDIIMNSLYEKNNREMDHSRRVSEICEAIATKLHFDRSEIHKIKVAGLMHDIGKIGIPDSILNKVGALTREEWHEIRQHSEVGYRILSSANEFSELSEFVLAHHERWDGKGYPKGLKGDEIPVQSRIIAIADAFDAMTSDRTYRKGLSYPEAKEEILLNIGKQFDPEIATLFLDLVFPEIK
ncbi:MAG: hypothetical protein A2Y20_02600 [Firmicutes bacterium GWF2_51_9]|nr:MAG: hypothetical protein A2Y20_02600 [Firmicutes bacterium GWF2_51_9]OGS57457.1 MAG: hypothetical protein A2Y19_03045 [Firmicutes bacterium GWE2_51_13]HAM63941.1 diguanylate cyclase [Erysipelotrichaceae bacterium]HBZ42059.1 diguanylate cyclase [Erysipelotrichaceae bacterium]